MLRYGPLEDRRFWGKYGGRFFRQFGPKRPSVVDLVSFPCITTIVGLSVAFDVPGATGQSYVIQWESTLSFRVVTYSSLSSKVFQL